MQIICIIKLYALCLCRNIKAYTLMFVISLSITQQKFNTMSKEHTTPNERSESLKSCTLKVKEMKRIIRATFLAKGAKSTVYQRLDKAIARECIQHIASFQSALNHLDDLVHEEQERKEVANG